MVNIEAEPSISTTVGYDSRLTHTQWNSAHLSEARTIAEGAAPNLYYVGWERNGHIRGTHKIGREPCRTCDGAHVQIDCPSEHTGKKPVLEIYLRCVGPHVCVCREMLVVAGCMLAERRGTDVV